MSSILDALKKIETEKTEAAPSAASGGFGVDADDRDLVARATGAGARTPLAVTPLTILIGGGILTVLLVAVSVAVASYYMLRSTPVVSIEQAAQGTANAVPGDRSAAVSDQAGDTPPEAAGETQGNVAGRDISIAARPATEPRAEERAKAEADTPKPETPSAPASKAVAPDPTPQSASASLIPAATPPRGKANLSEHDADNGGIRQPMPSAGQSSATDATAANEPERVPGATRNQEGHKADPAVEPELPAEAPRLASAIRFGDPPAAVKPEDETVEPPPPSPVKETPRRVEIAPLDEPEPPGANNTELDLSELPVLTDSQRQNLGIPQLTINFVGMPTKRKPRPSALINLKTVYVGERIPDSNAILIGVEMHGIAIEANGQRFFVPN